jgi:hypothetical protein
VKYRQLRLSNEKVQAKLLPCMSAVEYMMAIGFAKITDMMELLICESQPKQL